MGSQAAPSGAESVIVYRRSREQMPAHDFEIDEALEEGVVVNWLRTITEAGEHALKVETMVLDENGWPQPTGQFETIEADTVVLALGQNVDQSLLTNLQGVVLNRDGVVEVGPDMMTAFAGVFAGGDMVPSERTVAVGHGKKAARRCLSCGNCFECGNCYGICPDNAVTKLGPGRRFAFKYDYCKGCAMCATECPCGAIKMVPEQI